jgi:uncharacterized protein
MSDMPPDAPSTPATPATSVTRTVIWHRLDQPGTEYCACALEGKGATFEGYVIAALDGRPIRVEYSVECDAAWATWDVWVRCYFADAPASTFKLERDDASRWKCIDLDRPADEVELPQVAGCIDVDLGISPATNTLPIRRLNLAVGESAEVTAAWVRFPTLTIEPLHQRYTRLDTNRYRYESDTGFSAELIVDEMGLVIDYPPGWERVAKDDRTGS